MKLLALLLSSLLHLLLLLATPSSSTFTPPPRPNNTSSPLPLLTALREIGLDAYADFLTEYPTPEMFSCDNIILYAPINSAVHAYQSSHPDPDPTPEEQEEEQEEQPPRPLSRRANAAKSAVNKNNFAVAAGATKPYSALPPKGTVFATGGGGTGGAKVATPAKGGSGSRRRTWARGNRWPWGEGERRYKNYDPTPESFVGTVTAGAGVRTKVLQEAVEFDKGIIYKVDSFFEPTTSLLTTLSTTTSSFNLTYLTTILSRFPHPHPLLTAQTLTLLAPTYSAFLQSGLDADTSPLHKLDAFLSAHSFINGFLGYTPEWEEGRCYRTDGGAEFVSRWDGRTVLGEAVVVGEDWIVQTGVVQVIDKVLEQVDRRDKEPRTGRTRPGRGSRTKCRGIRRV